MASRQYLTLKNHWAKYFEVARYIVLHFSFPDWLTEEGETDVIRLAT